MREDTKVIIALTLATLMISAFSMLVLMRYGPVGRAVESVNATFTIAETTTSTTSTSTTSTSTTSTVAPSTGGGGGGGGGTQEVIVDFDVIVSESLRGYIGDTLIAKVRLVNGETALNGILLSATSNNPGLNFVFSPSSISELNANEERIVDLIISTGGTNSGSFLINILAQVNEPGITERAYLFIDLIESGQFNRTVIVNRLSFTKDLFKENPECLELNEVIERADIALAEGRLEDANNLIESAVRACRDLVTSEQEPVEQQPADNNLAKIIAIIIGIILLVMIGYEVFRYRFENKIARRTSIGAALVLVSIASQFAYTGLATRTTPNLLDMISLQILIALDIILLITYLRLRFTR